MIHLLRNLLCVLLAVQLSVSPVLSLVGHASLPPSASAPVPSHEVAHQAYVCQQQGSPAACEKAIDLAKQAATDAGIELTVGNVVPGSKVGADLLRWLKKHGPEGVVDDVIRHADATNSVGRPVELPSDIKTWNQFQSATKGQFVSRADAAKGWDLYKQANGIQTGAQRSQAAKSFFLKQLGASGKAPKWMNQYLSKGKVPPGYNVDHQVALSAGGADSPLNMRLKDIATHKTRHKYYRPWE